MPSPRRLRDTASQPGGALRAQHGPLLAGSRTQRTKDCTTHLALAEPLRDASRAPAWVRAPAHVTSNYPGGSLARQVRRNQGMFLIKVHDTGMFLIKVHDTRIQHLICRDHEERPLSNLCSMVAVCWWRGSVPSAWLAVRGSSAGQRGVRADRGDLAARRRAARLPAARRAAQAPGGARGAGQAPHGRLRPRRARRVPVRPHRTRRQAAARWRGGRARGLPHRGQQAGRDRPRRGPGRPGAARRGLHAATRRHAGREARRPGRARTPEGGTT